MFVIYLGLGIVVAIFIVYFGLQLSKQIYHPTLITFFWILYLASVLTIINVIATGAFYNILRLKRGVPGDQGRIGDKGDFGETGVCDIQCDSKVCIVTIMDSINKTYLDLITKALGKNAIVNESAVIKNSEITNKVKLICKSVAYKEISKIRAPKLINDYVADIYSKWITLLVNSDKSTDKKVIRDYLETDGMDEQPDLPGDPFKEIEKYDAYYWGSDRIFHPRVVEYCSDPKEYAGLTQLPPPRLDGVLTNMYENIISAGNMGSDLTVSRAGPLNYHSKTFYSLGDVFTYGQSTRSGGKFIEKYGVPENEKDRTQFDVSSDGPQFPTLLLNASAKYLKPPNDWVRIWRNRKHPLVTVWKPLDYYDNSLKKWFRACGYLVMNNWNNSTPRQQYGYNTPEAQPIRLVAEELLEEVTNAGYSFVWRDKGSRVRGDLSAWMNKNSKYREQINVSTLVPYYDYPRNVKSYTIKKSAFEVTDEMLPLNFKDDLVDEKKYGIGFHGSPHRSAKYSVFAWLKLPLEVQLTNLGNSYKIYIKHSGLNKVNSYMLRKQYPNRTDLSTYIGNNGDAKEVTENNNFNPSNRKLIWEILCIDTNGNLDSNCNNPYYLIRHSVNTNLYFKVEVDKSANGEPYYILSKLPNKNDVKYEKLIKEYIWYNPLSASGAKLEMKK
jgi:hypothetical protein